MNANSTTSPVPGFLWRVMTILGLWLLTFGASMAVTPIHMESGYNVTHENLGATLCSPILGCMGLAYYLGGHRPSLLIMVVSIVIIVGSTALMLFRCRAVRAFWTLIAAHIIITVSSIGFTQLSQYWNESP